MDAKHCALAPIFLASLMVPASTDAVAQEIKTPAIACAIHIEGTYEFEEKLRSMGCKAGDPLLFYNYSTLSKWNVIMPVRVAAIAACDLRLPISDVGAVGAAPYQAVICTFSGQVRKIKAEEKYLQGWNWEP